MNNATWDDEDLMDARAEADAEMAQLQAAGRRHDRAFSRMKALQAAGDFEGAARACPHGGGYPLDSLGAENHKDPEKGGKRFPTGAVRCDSCYSILSGFPWEGTVKVLEAGRPAPKPCECEALNCPSHMDGRSPDGFRQCPNSGAEAPTMTHLGPFKVCAPCKEALIASGIVVPPRPAPEGGARELSDYEHRSPGGAVHEGDPSECEDAGCRGGAR